MLWCLIFMTKLSTLSLLIFFFFFVFLWYPPAVCLSRSLLLPLPHCFLVLWCFNRWINDCFYFNSTPSCLAPKEGFEIEFGRKTDRETYLAEGFLQRMTLWAVSQQLNISAYLSCYWHVKGHGSPTSSCRSPHPQHAHSLWTWQLHFISSLALSFHFWTNALLTPDLNRSSRLITLCIPCPLNVTSTAAALLGVRTDRVRGLTLLRPAITCIIPPRPKPLITDQKLVCMANNNNNWKVELCSLENWLSDHY